MSKLATMPSFRKVGQTHVMWQKLKKKKKERNVRQ